MATDANQVAESGQNNEIDDKALEGADTPENQQNQDEGGDSPFAELAQKMGWVPRDQFTGNPEDWKPADQFILDGREIQRETSRELKSVRQQLDTIAKTSATIVEQRVNERVEELTAKYNKAVDDGDGKQAFDIAKEITTLTSEKPAGAPQPGPEVQQWVERNSSWFRQPGHEYATARAIEITNLLQSQGITDHAQQLKIAEQRLRVEKLIPEASQQRNGKPPAGVHEPGSRTSGAGNRQKGFSDMPTEAQKIARDMADRGVIKSVDDYAKNYFANEQAKR